MLSSLSHTCHCLELGYFPLEMAEINPASTCSSAPGVIREQKRREAEAERVHQRQQAVNRARKNLKEVEAELSTQNAMTQEELSAALAKIKRGNQTSHLDLRALKQALHDPKNSVAFLRTTGSLQAVVGHLTGRKALHQLEAAYICCNLAIGDEYHCDTVANAAGPYLMEFLESQNTALQVACIWTLGNLAGGSAKSFRTLQSQGFVDRLTNCLKSPHEDVIEAATYALCLVLKNSSYNLPLEDRLKLASIAVQLKCCRENVDWLIYMLSCKADCDEILIGNMVPLRCVDFLTTFSRDSPMEVDDLSKLRSVTASLRTISNLCSEGSGKAALTVITHTSFPMVLNDLLHARHPHLRLESEWLGRNILSHSFNEITAIARSVKLDVVFSAKDHSHIQIHQLLKGGI